MEKQGGAPSKPTFQELHKEAWRKAKEWRDGRRRAQLYKAVVAADRIERMDLEATVGALVHITGAATALRDDAGGGGEPAV